MHRKKRSANLNPLIEDGKPLLSVVVATYDRHEVLADALNSLLAQDVPDGFIEVIVVDNSPDQEAAARFGARYADETRIDYRLEPRPGLSNARNVGTSLARADIVAFVDDDAIAAPDWARQIVAAFKTDREDIAIVGGRILPRWVQPKPRWLPESLLGYLSVIDWGGDLRPLKSNEWLAGCNIAFDKKALVEAGGFSAALGRVGSVYTLLSNEETDAMERIKASGKTALYSPDALVEHVIDPERLTRQWFRRRAAWQAVSDFIKDSKAASKYAPIAAERLFQDVPSQEDVPGFVFFAETDDPVEFGRQVDISYDLVTTLLSGGEEIDSSGRLLLPGPLKQKIKATVRRLAPHGSRLKRITQSINRS